MEPAGQKLPLSIFVLLILKVLATLTPFLLVYWERGRF